MSFRLRILRNQEGASPGGGAVPPPGAAPSTTTPPVPAQGASAASAATFDPAMVKAIVDAVVPAVSQQVHDRVFADARRAGLVGSKVKAPAPAATGDGTAPSPASSVNLRPLDRAIANSGRKLDELAYGRMERSFIDEQPEDATAWVNQYFEGFGGTSPAPAAPALNGNATTAPASQLNANPVTNRGTPPAPTVPLEQRPILGMSPEDQAALMKLIGPAKYRAKWRAETKGMTVSLGGR